MSLHKKPVDDETVKALIKKGGSVPDNEADNLAYLQIRAKQSLVRRIDTALNKRLAKPSRHVWLIEAIVEKLEREG